MNTVFDFLSAPLWQHLALALLHTLWQGLAAAVLLWLLLRRIPANRPETRYCAALAALVGLVLCGLITWSVLDLDWPPSSASAEAGSVQTKEEGNDQLPKTEDQRPKTEAAILPRVLGHGPSVLGIGPSMSSAGRPAWLAFVTAGWLLGAALMMMRMVWTVARLRRFARGPEVTDNRIREMIDELRNALCVRQSLRIVETAERFGPAVLGIIRPLLALPVSMLTGLPPDTLRAVLAHELAHIRRHDYLLNLVQMVIEAVLFFNPAVWWINRQIRIEREACCDWVASRVIGQPLVLAEALSLWAERVFARGAPAAAFASPGRRGPRLLLDRVRRMVLPGYHPPMAVSPLGFLGLLLGGIAVLGGLACGTAAVVELAAKALTPAERIERIVQTQRQYAPPEAVSPDGKTTLSGKIRTRGGEPVPKNVGAYTTTRSGNNSSFASHGARTPDFSITTGAGKIWLQFVSDGYAPAIVGPYNGKAGETISGIEVFLDRGFAATVRVSDEKGTPVDGAKVTGCPIIDGGSFGRADPDHITDARGVATIPQAIERDYRFYARKAGFQPIEGATLPVKPQRPLILTLPRAQPLRGVVLSSGGLPVVGAEIRRYAKFTLVGGMTVGDLSGQSGAVMAVTDAQGRFVLDELNDDATYALLIISKEHGWRLVRDVTAKQKELRVEVGPELIISGTIRGDLGTLTKDHGKAVVVYGQEVSIQFGNSSSGNSNSGRVPVEASDDRGTFTIRGLLPGRVSITAGAQTVHTTVGPSEPRQQVTIDLTRPATQPLKRQVVMRFTTPDGSILPRGTIRVYMVTSGEDRQAKDITVPLEAGVARFDAYVSERIHYQPKDLLGYWFQSGDCRIEPGQGPQEIDMAAIPAGAIAGQVFNVDAAPATENVSVGVHGVLTTGTFTQSGGFDANIKVDGQGRYFITPLPLAGRYVVTATRGHTIQSAPVTLDDAQPTVSVTLQLPRTAAAEGTILDSQGRPLPRFPFSLAFSGHGVEGLSWGHGWEEHTDQNGRFRFDDLSVDVGQYALEFKPRRDFRELRVPLPLDGKPVTARLERGLVIEGQVLDSDTGSPVPGVELYAMPSEYTPGNATFCEAEALTDAEGRFRFSNLEDRPYGINNRSGLGVTRIPPDQTWMPGKKPIVLRWPVPEGSPLKPHARS